MKRFFLHSMCLFLVHIELVKGQNLIPNAKMRYITNDTNLHDTRVIVPDWFHSDGSIIEPDLTAEYKIGTLGVLLFLSKMPHQRVYLETALTETLEKGKEYDIELKLKIATSENIDEIAKEIIFGLAFSPQAYLNQKREIATHIKPFFTLTYFNEYNDLRKRRIRQTWAKEYGGVYDTPKELWQNKDLNLKMTYKAKGGENFLIIGNFNSDDSILALLGKKIKLYPDRVFGIAATIKAISLMPKQTTRRKN